MDRKELKRMAGTTIYNRGMDLYLGNGVICYTMEPDEEEWVEQIEGQVRGSGRRIYNVELVYDYRFAEFVHYYCDCPAYYSYDGPCKHCVALGLEYINDKERRDNMPNWLKQQEAEMRMIPARRTGSGYSPSVKPLPKTTPAMKTLLGRQIMKRSLPIVQKDILGKVMLEPFLYINGTEVYVSFKIGITHKYVLKDVFQFVELVMQNAEFSYGQKLGFIHDMSAFEPQSRPLVQFLINWVENNKKRYERAGYYGYGYQNTLPKLRDVTLSAGDLERFLLSVCDRAILTGIWGKGEHCLTVTDEKYPLSIQICGKENGIEVSMEDIVLLQTDHYWIYFRQDKIYIVKKEEIETVQGFMDCLYSLPKKMAYIEKEDVVAFCRELLPNLEKCFICVCDNFKKEDYGVEEVTFEIYLDSPQRDYVTCRLMAVYGEKKYNVYDTKTTETWRDYVREREMGTIVSEYCNAYDEETASMVLAEDEEKLYLLLTEGIVLFQTLGEVYVSDALKRIKVTSAPKTSIGVSLSGDLLELTMSAEDMPMEQLKEILSRYNRKKKYYRLKNGDFVNMEDESMNALLELKEGLRLTESQMHAGKVALPKYRALYLDEASKEWETLGIVKNREFRSLIRNMKTVEDNDFDIPEILDGVLREYQKKGFLWLKTLKHNGFGGILADDMGLGKTLQVIAFLLSEYADTKEEERRPVLIVSPASLVYNWCSEFERFAPELSVKMMVGTPAERKALLDTAKGGEILLTSYDLLKRDCEAYEGIQFACEVIDEAQYIKNHNTQVAKAVKRIQAGFRLALTGTPIENRLSELWSIFDYLMPGLLYSYQQFRSTFETPIVQENKEEPGKRLQRMIRPFVLRRLKKEVLKELPDKLEENMYVRLEGEQQKLYDAHVKRLALMLDKHSDEEFRRNKIQVLSELTRLRQICCSPALIYDDYKGESAKEQLCVDVIKNAVNGGHKLLLFSQFTSMLSQLCDSLKEEGISHYVLTGATGKEERKRLVEAFQKDDTSVFCISLKAGGTGLNLTAADIVIHYDPWWNLAVQNQATDRVHRIGQKNVVNVYKIIAKNTIEEKIVKLQDKKKELAEQLLGGEGMDRIDFSREELLELLKN